MSTKNTSAPQEVETEIDAVAPHDEQRKIPDVDDGVPDRPDDIAADETQPTGDKGGEKDADEAKPEDDPRDRIAARSRERRAEEIKNTAARIVGEDDPEPEAPAPELKPDDVIRVKARKEVYQLTRAQRDEMLADEHGDDAIAEWSEGERNRMAQLAIANRSYERELEEHRESLRKSRNAEPEQRPQQDRQTEPEPERETPEQKHARAVQIIQMGGDAAEAARLMSEAADERAQALYDDRRSRETEATRHQAYDRDMQQGLQELGEKVPGFADPANRRARDLLDMERAEIQRGAIQYYITQADETTQMAFDNAGWTRQYVESLPSHQVAERYRELAVAGHRLPSPSRLTALAAARLLEATGAPQPGQNTSETTTRSNRADTPQSAGTQPAVTAQVDRSGRKDRLTATPERASVPRQQQRGAPPPKQERERARAAISEMRQHRR